MKKPPRIKPGKARSKPSLQQLTTANSHTTPKLQTKALPQEAQYKKLSGSALVSIRERFWPAIGALLTAANIAGYFWPSLTLATGANLDPQQDFQTSFVATNTGHVPLYGITFVCELVGNQASIGHLETAGDAYGGIPVLKKGEPATRSCFKKSLAIDGPMLRVTAYYHWPLIGTIANTTAYFSPRRGETGTVLVQEPEPNQSLPVIVRVGSAPQT